MTDKLDTLLAHAGIKTDTTTGALVSPIHCATTYQHPEFGQSTGYDYIRTKNPTRSALEQTLAAIERADFALATSSGMAAIVLAFSVFAAGSKVLAVRDLYGGTYRWFAQDTQQQRFSFTYVATPEALTEALTREAYDVVFIESPTNPLMVSFDLTTIIPLAKQRGATVIVDNTFYTPIYQQPIALGADIVVHSATKYLGGHNDVLAGAVITHDAQLYEQLFYNLNTTGAVLSPFDSYLLLRGLKTLALRMERATANARAVVAYLQTCPAVRTVLYPGLGGMVSFKVTNPEQIPNILSRVRIFSFAESLGGVESLITYPTTQTHADIPQEVRHSYGLTDDLLRLSIGIEDPEDLIADLRAVLEVPADDRI